MAVPQQPALNEQNGAIVPAVNPLIFTQDEILKKRRQAHEAAFKQRKGFQKTVSASMPSAQQQGSVGQAQHLAGLSPEGVVGAMIMDFILLMLEMLFNTHHLNAKHAFSKAAASIFEHEMPDGHKETFSMAYKPNANDVLPPVYPIDPATDQPDFSANPLLPGQINDYLIRKNGYIPRPTVTQGLENAFLSFMARTQGVTALSSQEMMQLYNTYDQNGPGAASGHSLASDNTVLNNQRPRPQTT